ncbi:hypothetical protein [Streptacidiphilus melanogenes]|uniref:hypothetical protein n=1 Tax=Streptacidiphilus melanogenes TaxID=411235 RepID=UPI000B336E4F|nr:hypothetical protein [Streptacidiphilus melanogenes]
MMQLASALDTVNTFIDSRGVLGALLVAAITTGAGLFWRSRRPAREISWGVLYDEPINQGQDQPGGDPHASAPGQNQGPNFWDIQFRNKPVKQGSLVLLRVRNAGETAIKEEDFRPALSALRGHGFLACGDLTGTKRDGACSG